MRALHRQLLVLVLVCSCRELLIPPLPGPGSVQGRLVYAVPGRLEAQPAAKGRVSLLASGLETVADDEGRFVLAGLVKTTGSLLFSFDADGDGVVDHQRLLELQPLKVRPGLDLNLGDVALSHNATVRGRVLRQGGSSTTGLGGTAVFIAGSQWSTFTADDGSYTLAGLPEGALQVSFFAEDFVPFTLEASVGPADDKRLPDVTLVPGQLALASVTGRVVTANQAPATEVKVRLASASQGERQLPVTGGNFKQESLKVGLYTFGFERAGSLSFALYNVLLPSGETDLGTLTMLDGASTPLVLTVIGSYDGGADAGAGDAGVGDAGAGDAGVGDAGAGDAGAGDAGAGDAGAGDAGVTGPVALVSGPALVAAGSMVTVSGMSSTGAQPLVYQWTQLSGPAVTLSVNNSVLAHSPSFTAPAIGSVLEWRLVVVDRLGVASAPAVLRVAVGGPPVARFVPDGGLVFGGQLLTLSSTSYDDAGLAVVGYDWQLVSGTRGTLSADGGPTAQWRAPTVAFGAPDEVAALSLRVTNSIGASSALATQFFTVRGASPQNWSLDAGPQQAIAVGVTPPTVLLSGSVSTLIPSPKYTVSWSCTPALPLVGADTLAPRFVAPVIAGPTVNATCQVQAVGEAPLDPPTLSASVNVLLRDTAPPQLSTTSIELLRSSRLAVRISATEALSTLTLTGCAAYGYDSRIVGASALLGTSYNVLNDGNSCGPFSVVMTDQAQVPNSSGTIAIPPATATVASAVWSGPFVSTDSFDDPRPVVASLGPLPQDQQVLWGANPVAAPAFELVASQGGQLVRFTGLDVVGQPTCSPSCPLATVLSVGGLGADAVPTGSRVAYGGADLFVAMTSDGGLTPTYVHRSAAGSWSLASGFGSLSSWDTAMRSVRVSGTSLLVDTWNPDAGVVLTEVAATGVSNVLFALSQERYVFAIVGPNRTPVVRRRNADATWSAFTPAATISNVSSMTPILNFNALEFVGFELSPDAGFALQRLDYGNPSYVYGNGGLLQGYDAMLIGGTMYLVYGFNGDIRFKVIAGSVFSGAGGGAVDFGGPPRAGYPQPYPPMLDNDITCEAAWPHFTSVNEAVVVTWQERCAPSTSWQVVSRVVR